MRKYIIFLVLWSAVPVLGYGATLQSTAAQNQALDDANASNQPSVVTQLRMQQGVEESQVRVVSQQLIVDAPANCSTAQMVRQRLRDLGSEQSGRVGDVTVQSGHGSVAIDGNQGQIDNSINIQVVNPNEARCL